MKTGSDFNHKTRPEERVLKIGSDYANVAGEAQNAYTLMIKWVATNDSRYGDTAIGMKSISTFEKIQFMKIQLKFFFFANHNKCHFV